jgi:hypothetical protein
VQGIVTIQSGQPYSVIDYSGAVGSVFYSINDGITNPIVPLAPGCTPKSALTGATGNNFNAPSLKASCFTVPQLLRAISPTPRRWTDHFPARQFRPGTHLKPTFCPAEDNATSSGSPGRSARIFPS